MDKKIFKTLEEQCNLLKERNMNISENMEKEISVLKKYNYAHLIYSYGEIFLQKGTKLFQDNTKLYDVVNFLNFEKRVISWVGPFIYRYEHVLKSSVAYNISKLDGAFAHYKKKAYDQSKTQKILKIQRELKSVEYYNFESPKIKENLIKGRIPIWILVNFLSFNQILLLFEALNNTLQKQILEDIDYAGKAKDFISGSWVVKEYRNRYCHNAPIHTPYYQKRKSKPCFLNDCIIQLMRLKSTKKVKLTIVDSISKMQQENSLNKELEWLAENFKIMISRELEVKKKENSALEENNNFENSLFKKEKELSKTKKVEDQNE